jgi:hypothetical protein
MLEIDLSFQKSSKRLSEGGTQAFAASILPDSRIFCKYFFLEKIDLLRSRPGLRAQILANPADR